MKPWTLPEKIVSALVVMLAIAGVGFLIYHNGEKQGAVKQELKANAAVVKDLRVAAVVVRAQTVAKRAEYRAARAKVQVKGDTVIADGQTVELPSVANLVRAADAHSAQDSTDQAKQDLLVGALGTRVDLLQHEKEPWCGRRCGVAIGVVGTGAVVYLAVRIIKALGHK